MAPPRRLHLWWRRTLGAVFDAPSWSAADRCLNTAATQESHSLPLSLRASRESQGEPAMENSDERVHLSARLFTGGPIRCLVGHSSIGNGPKGMSGQTQASVDPDESRWLILSSSLFSNFTPVTNLLPLWCYQFPHYGWAP